MSNKYKILTKILEKNVIEYQRNESEEGLEAILGHYFEVLGKISVRYFNEYNEDYVALAIIEIIKGLKRYDATRGVKFSTFMKVRLDGTALDLLKKYKSIQDNVSYKEDMDLYQCSENAHVDKDDILEIVKQHTTDREYTIFINYVLNSLNFTEIGTLNGVSGSRIHQIYDIVIKKLGMVEALRDYI